MVNNIGKQALWAAYTDQAAYPNLKQGIEKFDQADKNQPIKEQLKELATTFAQAPEQIDAIVVYLQAKNDKQDGQQKLAAFLKGIKEETYAKAADQNGKIFKKVQPAQVPVAPPAPQDQPAQPPVAKQDEPVNPPAAEEKKAEQPVNPPAAEEKKADQPANPPVAEEKKADQPANPPVAQQEQPAQQPVVEEKKAEQPVVEEKKPEQPAQNLMFVPNDLKKDPEVIKAAIANPPVVQQEKPAAPALPQNPVVEKKAVLDVEDANDPETQEALKASVKVKTAEDLAMDESLKTAEEEEANRIQDAENMREAHERSLKDAPKAEKKKFFDIIFGCLKDFFNRIVEIFSGKKEDKKVEEKDFEQVEREEEVDQEDILEQDQDQDDQVEEK